MPTIIDNIELDETNEEFNQAADFVSSTDKLIFLTGKAGTGKTTFLKYIKSVTDKNTIVVAPTGVAAINACGVTISSFFQIPFGPFVPNDKRLRTSKDIGDNDDSTIYSTFRYSVEKRSIIEGLELLIIDEVSMVRCDTLDTIDRILRVFRKKPLIPFGGVQIILIGDPFQLSPIAKNDEWQILSQFYKDRFFFSSNVMKSLIIQKNYLHFELKKIYRQKEQDYIDLLNRVRVNQVLDSDLKLLSARFNPLYNPKEVDNYIILSTHNTQVDQTNKTKLDELQSELVIYSGELKGVFPTKDGQPVLPTDLELKLKEGAQIMLLKNDIGRKYFNGKIGKIKSLSKTVIVVEFSDGTKVPIEKATWEHIEYSWNKEKKKVEEVIKGTFTQYPLRLSWAITVHKSQGLTFEKVFADLGAAFTDGQVYVALSRCMSINGLHLKSIIRREAINANKSVIEFAKNETPGTLIVQQLNEGKADFYYKKSREALLDNDFESAFTNFITAIKFRNDIETELFKRYLIAVYSRLLSNKRIVNSLIEESDKRKIEIEEVRDECNNLQLENESQSKKLNEQNISLKLLFDKIKELEKSKDISEKKSNDLRLELSKVNDNLSSTQAQNKSHEKKISELQNIIKIKEQEIIRVKNIKWYQKLFGAK